MKKLFMGFLLLMAINAGAQTRNTAFDIKAQVFGGFNFLRGDTVEPDTINDAKKEIYMGGLNAGKGQLEANGSINNFGGWLRLGYEFEKDWFGDFDVWWRQSEKFAFYLTYNDDGHFAQDRIPGWNFYGLAGDVLGIVGYADRSAFYGYASSVLGLPRYSGSSAFYEGFKRGAFILLNPAEPLEINLGFNMFNEDTVEYMFKGMTLQLAYDTGKNGKLAFTYEGDHMTEASLEDNPILSFYYSVLNDKSASIDIGLRFRIMDERVERDGSKRARYHPLNIGLAAIFPGEKVNTKLRVLVNFLGHEEYNGEKLDTRPFELGFDILPYMALKEGITGYLNAGLYLSIPDEGENDLLWHLNPYIVIGDESRAAFYAGISLYNTAIEPRALYFAIPIGLSIIF